MGIGLKEALSFQEAYKYALNENCYKNQYKNKIIIIADTHVAFEFTSKEGQVDTFSIESGSNETVNHILSKYGIDELKPKQTYRIYGDEYHVIIKPRTQKEMSEEVAVLSAAITISEMVDRKNGGSK